MPLRDSWQTRIKAVERQYAAVQLATSRLLEEGRRDPTALKGDVQHRDVVWTHYLSGHDPITILG